MSISESQKTLLSPFSLSPSDIITPHCELVCHLQMQIEDFSSALLRLHTAHQRLLSDYENTCAALKANRQKTMLAARVDLLTVCIEEENDENDLRELQKSFEELTITYWLQTNDKLPDNPFLTAYVKSLFQDPSASPPPPVSSEIASLTLRLAQLQKEVNNSLFALTICARTINRLSHTIADLYSVPLPVVTTVPELEVPEVCEAIVRAVAMVEMQKGARGSNRGKKSTRDSLRFTRSNDLELEELAFQRDLYRRQNQVMKELYCETRCEDKESALIGRLEAMERAINRGMERLLAAQFQREKQFSSDSKEDVSLPLEALGKTISTKVSSECASPHPRRSPFMGMSPIGTPRVMSETDRILESAQMKLEAIDREWKGASRTRLIASLFERKMSISPRVSRKLTSLRIPVVGGETRSLQLSTEEAISDKSSERPERFRQPTTRTLKSVKSKAMAPS